MRLLYIMDPVESIIPDKDTTLAFLSGGQRRGHENFHALQQPNLCSTR